MDLCSRCMATLPSDVDTVERFDLYDPNIDSIESGEDAGGEYGLSDGAPIISSERERDEI